MRPNWSTLLTRATAIILVTCGLSAQAAPESANADARKEPTWLLEFPKCERDEKSWKNYSPLANLMDWTDPGWRKSPKELARFKKYNRIAKQTWLREDAVDFTWIDIDGDGWCDVITSSASEPYNKQTGKPILLLSPQGIYLRTQQGFKPHKSGMMTNEYHGSSLIAYWDTVSKSAVLITRVYQGNLVDPGDSHEDEYHFRQLLRAAFSALAAGDEETYDRYYIEAEPFFHGGRLMPGVAEEIWEEEARRAGVRDKYK